MSARLRLVALGLGVGCAAVVVFVSVSRSPARVHDLMVGYGVLGPLVFVAVTALLSCAFFPAPLLAGASGLLFGTALGTPVSIVAGTASAALAFMLARHGARPAVEEFGGPRTRRWREWVERGGFVAVLYARLAPLATFTPVNYAAGLTRLRVGVFAGATALGIAPRAFAYTALGGSLKHLGSPEALAAVGLLVAMALLGAALLVRERRLGRGVPVPPGA